jgi:hypothetical protein
MRFLKLLLRYLKRWLSHPVHDRDIIDAKAILYMEANPDLWDV